MALVQRFGKPDIFATMTCNPNWPEIKAELAVGEKPQNRPDLIARIFHSKQRLARKEIMDKKIFGEVAALIYVIEFQKRGLPHAHFLIILKPSHKIKSPEDFDKFVSAEIPSTENAYLRATVLSHMMHGPCGIAKRNCPCMKYVDGKRTCKSRYPKAFTEYTTSQDDGYPTYKRRNTGETVRVRQYHMDNRWVIPYNPYLLAMFDCHFNVEVCSTIQAVKYLYKYVYKGHDRISFNIGQDNSSQLIDEIDNFQSGRWVSPPEAAWRIFGFDLYEMYPCVMPLHIHCENLQSVSFAPTENLEAVVSNPQRCQTPLTEFFRINKEQHPCPNYLYSEFPEHYVWDGCRKTWKPRKKGKMIGRLTFVGPSETERFFLRLLLINVRAPTSFSDLKTVDGYECASFQEACIQRGIIEHSDAADKCLEEATAIAMPSALRTLYATLLIICNPPNPTYLWNKYYHSLSEDFRHLHPHSESNVLSMTAEKIEQHHELMGKQLSKLGLDHLKEVQTEQSRITRDVRDAYNAPVSVECSEARKQLNSGQRHAYKAILRCVKSNSSGVFFVDGPGGTGKTFLYCSIYAKVRLMGKIALATASSGIAAGCLPNGRTAHSRFKLPLDLNKGLACAVPKQGSLAKLLQETTLIIWDEAPMANKANIHALDLLLKDICTSEQPFGGKIVVFGGDFRQVLPVLPHKPQIEAVQASLASSSLWLEFTRFYLYQNMRAKEDPSFASFLLQLGNGELQSTDTAHILLPATIESAIIDTTISDDDLIQELFPQICLSNFEPTAFSSYAVLTTTNDEVDKLNSAFINRFQGDTVIYESYDSLLDDNCHIYPTEFLHTLCPGGMSPHKLVLKKKIPVILLRNIDPSSGLCNGTRLVCKRFFPNMILCEISVGSFKGNQAMFPRINFRPSTASNFPFQFERKQFPIKLCFAMTINKSQGQTLDEVVVYLKQPCFSHGQLYVALSRAKKSSKVKLVVHSSATDDKGPAIKNVVSFEILRRAGII